MKEKDKKFKKKFIDLMKVGKKAKAENNKGISNHNSYDLLNFRTRPDYFARFRYNEIGLIRLLKSSHGLSYVDHPHLFQILDDLGHWTLVRNSATFNFSEELELTLRNQFKMLENSYKPYKVSDVLIWGDISLRSEARYLVRILEVISASDNELYRVEAIDTSATFLVSRFELDFWNAPGSTLPVDHLSEVIDWSRDQFWLKKLNDFKIKMASIHFSFDFGVKNETLVKQRENLVNEVMEYFSLMEGNLTQMGRGLGILACGQGTREVSSLIQAMAIQALGQVFGISGRLWGQVENFELKPSFILLDCNSENKNLLNLVSAKPQVINPIYRPIQRPLGEVLRRVVAKESGPFGLPERVMKNYSLKNPSAHHQTSLIEDQNSTIEK